MLFPREVPQVFWLWTDTSFTRDPSIIKTWEKNRIAEAAVSWEGGLVAFCGYAGSKYPLDEAIEFDDTV